MKLIVALCLVAAVAAAPPPPPQYKYQPSEYAGLVRYDNDNLGLGNYRYAYEQTDGQAAEQQGELRNEGREDEYVAVKGVYTWIAPNGVKYTVTYIADDNGFQPEIQEGPGALGPNVASLVGAG